MNGYFNKLIRMTGIPFAPGTGPGNPLGAGTATPRPIHAVETQWVDFSPSQSDPALESRPKDPIGTRKEYLAPAEKGALEIHAAGRHAPVAETDRSEIRPGRKEMKPHGDVPHYRSPKTQAPQSLEFSETVTLDNARDKRDGPFNPIEKTDVHLSSQPMDDSDQILQPPAKKPLIHEHIEVVEMAGKALNPSETPFYGEDAYAASAPKKGHPAHSHSGQIKGENSRPSDRTRERRQAEVTGGPTLEDVRQWVAQPDPPAPRPRPLHSPHPPQPDPGLLQESREFSLSIGTISVTLEDFQTGIGIPRNPPAPVPQNRRRATKATGATPASRLGRHYIRLRG